MAEIRLERVTKLFKQVKAVDDVELTIHDGEFMVLLGPSGCGKTTLLRSIAGLEQVDAGRIRIGDRDVTDLPPRDRKIAMVFQSYAVFPHMTVFENVAFGLRMAKTSDAELRRRVTEAAELLHIGELLARYPSQTSGGQRQRIAVARAVATQPQVLLMDEPLSNLDALLRLEMRAELKRLLAELGSTTVYVTHDQVEALSMGDRIAVMRDGRILQVGDPLGVYDAPVNRFVGGFIGNPPMNFLEVEIVVRGRQRTVQVAGAGEIALDAAGSGPRESGSLVLGIRAENIDVLRGEATGGLGARTLVVEPLGSHNLVTLQLGEQQVKATTRPDEHLDLDEEVRLGIDLERARWLDPTSGDAVETPARSAEPRQPNPAEVAD